MAVFFFSISIVMIIYTFLGYPVILSLAARFFQRRVQKDDISPEVTIVIPVHNEEKAIKAKLENCLSFDYPGNKLKILIVSDGSTDDTEAVVKKINSNQIQFITLPFRGGKVMAQNYATNFCDSEIVIFTDVAIILDKKAVRYIVQHFADKTIGAVSCTDAIIGDKHEAKGEQDYIRYDMMVRKYTSQIGSLIGVTGGFYAVRSQIVQGGWNPSFPPDFYVAIRCMKKGMRVIEDQRVKAYYKTAAKEWDELPRKVRTINRGIHALLSKPNRILLNPLKFGVTSFQLISHKLFRWMVPFFLIALFFSNWILVDQYPALLILFVPQLLIYIGSVLSFFIFKSGNFPMMRLLRYFFIANTAILKAWFEFFIGKKYAVWNPTKR